MLLVAYYGDHINEKKGATKNTHVNHSMVNIGVSRGRVHLSMTETLMLVGARGFEPPTSSTPLKRATYSRYTRGRSARFRAKNLPFKRFQVGSFSSAKLLDQKTVAGLPMTVRCVV